MEKEEFRVYKDTRYNPKGALWEVSNYGNVRKNGEDYIPYEQKNGYLGFGSYYVHRAVGELFISNPENKKTIDHKNRNRHDNRASNLRWATMKEQAENMDWESIRMKMSKSLIGNKNALGHNPSEEARTKLGMTTLGTSWVINPTTAQSARIDPSKLPEFLDKGYIKGRKIKK